MSIVSPQDASGSPGDVSDDRDVVDSLDAAQASKSEAAHHGSSSELPLDLTDFHGAFRTLGWDRLIPYNFLALPWGPYGTYLEQFYKIHKSPPISAADAALLCLEKENDLGSWLESSRRDSVRYDISLTENIKESMIQFATYVQDESEYPFVVDAAACIAKEAELAVEMLRLGYMRPNQEYVLSQEIRQWAYKLVIFQGEWSPSIAAVLLGIIKEAEWLLKNMRGSSDSRLTSMHIRRFTAYFLWDKLECESEDPAERSSQMASEIVYNATEVNQPTWGNTDTLDSGGFTHSEKYVSDMKKQPKQNNCDGHHINLDETF